MDTSLRILLVEDDPTSALFISAALERLPAQVDRATSAAEALRLACEWRHDAWLIDARLPDGDGGALLQQLRDRGLQSSAIAHTASSSPVDREALLARGFLQVLRKPLSADAIRAAVLAALGRHAPLRISECQPDALPSQPPVWDQDAAMRALNANADHITRLRGLFLGDLEPLGQQLTTQWRNDDLESVEAGLHRLRASCGFVGAARLGAAVAAWQDAPGDVERRSQFERALRETLDQLPPEGSSPVD